MKSIKLIALLALSVIFQPAVYAHNHKDHWVKKTGTVVWHAAEVLAGLVLLNLSIREVRPALCEDKMFPRALIKGRSELWMQGTSKKVQNVSFDRPKFLSSSIATGALLYHGITGLNDDLHAWERLKELGEHMSKKSKYVKKAIEK